MYVFLLNTRWYCAGCEHGLEICQLVQAQFLAHLSVWLSERRLVLIIFCKRRIIDLSLKRRLSSKEGSNLIWMVLWLCHLWFVKKKLWDSIDFLLPSKSNFLCMYSIQELSEDKEFITEALLSRLHDDNPIIVSCVLKLGQVCIWNGAMVVATFFHNSFKSYCNGFLVYDTVKTHI